ncbi:MAG: helix-turn-helix domain-containing protein [Acetobacteraceae bacterium]|jgi:CRP/FNR family transcriptional activator FtrB|nr:helix-turn-helix domain-containing protein [Acetobacteraceae bacterium]
MTEASTLALLGRVLLLRGVSDHARAKLLAGSTASHVPKGAPLFSEGEVLGTVPLLLAGRAALTAAGQGGQKAVITLLGEGDLVAIPPVLLGQPSEVGAVTTMASHVLALDAARLRAALAEEPGLCAAVLAMLARHWSALIEQMKDLKLHDSRTRVARWLAASAAASGGGAIKLAAPKAMLARNLGMTPESFSRALASLEAAGAISAAGSSIAILDRSLLEHATPTRHQ